MKMLTNPTITKPFQMHRLNWANDCDTFSNLNILGQKRIPRRRDRRRMLRWPKSENKKFDFLI